MKLAAVDIGSNAARILIADANGEKDNMIIQKREYIRFPLQLGKDVFKNGILGSQKIEKLKNFASLFNALAALYEVKNQRIYATSAMRDAENGKEVVELLKKELDFEIELIPGEREADIIQKLLIDIVPKSDFVHIDVGGGSTELNIIANNKVRASRSFKLGAFRMLNQTDDKNEWKQMYQWLQDYGIFDEKEFSAVGTGGNILKAREVLNVDEGQAVNLNDIINLQNEIETLSVEQRMKKWDMSEDRAEVIEPGLKLYITVMEWISCKKMYAPSVGLADGIIRELYKEILNEK